ncbi:MAG: segregation/condensation protein A [candidate division WOR-3 bacterium]
MSTALPEVRLEIFEGPIELLLYLVRQKELDITAVPIGRLTEDYLSYLRSTSVIDMEAAADFLVMAAILVRLKVRYLLPRPAEEDLTTPTVTLEQIIDQFRKYQRVAQLLSAREKERRQMFPRRGETPRSRLAEGEDLVVLAAAFRRVVARLVPTLPLQFEPRRVRIEDKLAELRQLLAERQRVQFDEAVVGHSLAELIVTFIALLELVRLGEVRVEQESHFGAIWLERGPRRQGQDGN